MRGLNKIGKSKVVLIIAIALSFIFLITQASANEEGFSINNINLVMDDTYYANEDIKVNIEPEEYRGIDLTSYLDMWIDYNNNKYKFFGKLNFPMNISLQGKGDYNISLVSKSSSQVITKESFEIKDKKSVERSRVTNQENTFIMRNAFGTLQEEKIQSTPTFRGASQVVNNPIPSINKISFRNVANNKPLEVGLDEIGTPINVNKLKGVRSYAIDPTTSEFTDALVTVTAEGSSLYMCKDYNFTTRDCWGSWERVRSITPGEEYTFMITPEDPLFTETDDVFECGCQDSVTNSRGDTIECDVYCEFTIDVPDDAVEFFLEEITYDVDLVIDTDGNADSGSQSGYFDHDTTLGNGNEILVGSGSSIASTNFIWTASDLDETGSQSFNNDNCDNWPSHCTYNVYLGSSFTFSTPGNSRRDASMEISANEISYTLNYTAAGDFSVVLESPPNNYLTNQLTNTFEYIPTSESTTIDECSLYTNDQGWNAKNTSTNVINGSFNSLDYTFSSPGTYAWNVECDDGSETVFATSNRTIIIDQIPPSIDLISPADEHIETSSNVVGFEYVVTGNSPIDHCTLNIDGEAVSNQTSPERNVNNVINHNLVNGDYNWSVSCVDNAGNDNVSEERSITVDVEPVLNTGLWYETGLTDCTTLPCQISLAQEIGTQNTISGSVPSQQTNTMVQALSPFLGGNGVEISSGSNILFSSYFIEGNNRLELDWYLYYRDEQDDDVLICSNTGGTATADASSSTGNCGVTEDVYIASTERLYYRIDVTNTHPSQGRTFVHAIDHLDSFLDADDFFQIGYLNTNILEPEDETLYGQGQQFNATCEIDCSFAYCLDVNVYVQTNQSGTWQSINGGDSINLEGTQNNPIVIGQMFNETQNVTFSLETGNPGDAHVRCNADAKYQEEFSDARKISVSTTEEPIISLDYPGNDSWINDEPVEFLYTPTTFASLNYCELYINDVLEDVDTSPSANSQNIFSVSGLNEERHNWSVSCEDTGGLVGNSSVHYFDIDREAPYNLTVFHPEQPEATVTSSTVNFNFTVQDARSESMTCDLYIDEALTETVMASNDTLTNITVSGFDVGDYTWRLSCSDLASNENTTGINNLTIIDVPPTVQLVSPEDETGVNESPATLSYIPEDGFGIQECRLYVDDVLEATDTDIAANVINTFEFTAFEAQYSWNVECMDLNNNLANSSQWTFYGDFTAPTVQLDFPSDLDYFETSNLSFGYTGFDNWDPLTCTININDEANVTTSTTSGTQVVEQISNLPDGNHDWDVMCTDIGGNTNTSETRGFTINQTPEINLDFPFNNTFVNTTNPELLYTPVDNDGFNYCELHLNGLFEKQNETEIISGEQQNFSVTGLNEGFYNWSVLCEDAGVFSNIFQTINHSFIVDVTPPTINLIDPEENHVVNTTSYTFFWNVTDNLAETMTCDLYLDGSINTSGVIVNDGEVANHTINDFVTKDYNWSVACIDEAGNFNQSETVNFTAIVPPQVELVSPANFTADLDRDVTFSYIPYGGTGDFTSCTLFLNEEAEDTSTSITADVVNNLEATNLPDGRYDWNVQCTDTNSLTGEAPEDFIYFVDNEEPYKIDLLNPLNNTIETANNVSFTFKAFDDVSPQMSCDVYLTEEGSAPFTIATGLIAENATNVTHHELLGDGDYSWFVDCTDLSGLFNVSAEYFFEVDAPPNVTLIDPDDEFWFNTTSLTLTYFPEDDFGVTSCDLLINGDVNQTDNSVINKQNNTFDLNNVEQGSYNWTVACRDTDANIFAPVNRTFYVDTEDPLVTLNYPIGSELLETSSVNFNFTVTDNLAPHLICDLYVNNSLNTAGIIVNNSVPHIEVVSGFDDGLFDWNVQCYDLANNQDTSITELFEVQEPPTVILGDPENNYRNNTVNKTLFYTPFDNSGEIEECTLLLNEQENITNTNVTHGVEQNFTLENLENGTYNWDVECTDPNNNTGVNGTPKLFHIDLEPPVMTLLTPEVDETFNQNDISFSWNATDFDETIEIMCAINISDPEGDRFIDDITGLSGSLFTHFEENLSDGEHFWNVTCTDDLGNTGTSETRRFVINQPNLDISNDQIFFNNTNPDLNETLNITANVSNLGGISAEDVLVEFWHEHPSDGGVLIGDERKNVVFNSSTIFSTSWNITEGFNTIHVFVDPYDEIDELNKSNNNASTNISVLKSVINEPVNGSVFGTDTINLNFTVQDYTGLDINYTIFVDGILSVTGVTTDNLTTIEELTLTEGVREIIVQAEDSLGRKKNSSTIEVIIDLTPPTPQTITLNETWFNTTTPEIEILITDNLADVINYTMYVNGTPDVTGIIDENNLENITLSTLPEGVYELILEGIDEAGNKANSTAIIIYVDITKPNIVLNAPSDEELFTTNDVDLNYTVFDNMASEAVCEINLNGNALGPFNVNVGEEQIHSLENLAEGNYDWNVTCTDEAGNNNVSETRTFNVFMPPVITLINPLDESWSNEGTNDFFYNVSDETGIDECRLYLNNNLEDTDNNVVNNEVNSFTVSNMEGVYDWRVECIDNSSFNTLGISDEWALYVDLEPPIPSILTSNNTWFNTAPLIDFIITDNMAPTTDYVFYINDVANVTGVVNNNTQSSETLNGLEDGVYEILIEGTDLANNSENSSPITIYQDTEAPQITLNEPLNDTNVTSTSVNLSFTVTDNLASYLICDVNLNNDIVVSNINVTEGVQETVEVHNLTGGNNEWDVTCADEAGNTNTSETWSFFVPIPDLAVNESEIYFSNEAPVENEVINITATVRNIGEGDADPFYVQFWEGSIGGVQIENDVLVNGLEVNESINVTVEYVTEIGETEIFVIADPNNEILEESLLNNNASRTLNVGFWHFAAGTMNDSLRITDASYGLLFDWSSSEAVGSNIYVTDPNSQINWEELQALGRTTTDDPSNNDFELLDESLGSSNYSDSVNNTYTNNGVILETNTYTVFGQEIENVPIVNSTDNANFKTGILWDYSSGGINYNGTQDVLFITTLNRNSQGFSGIVDFEIRIPATLREYASQNNDYVVFYTELT